MSENQFDVVVVGAGLSGLSAARRLQKRNPQLSVLVLEARGASQEEKKGGAFVLDILLNKLYKSACTANVTQNKHFFFLAAHRPCRRKNCK